MRDSNRIIRSLRSCLGQTGEQIRDKLDSLAGDLVALLFSLRFYQPGFQSDSNCWKVGWGATLTSDAISKFRCTGTGIEILKQNSAHSYWKVRVGANSSCEANLKVHPSFSPTPIGKVLSETNARHVTALSEPTRFNRGGKREAVHRVRAFSFA